MTRIGTQIMEHKNLLVILHEKVVLNFNPYVIGVTHHSNKCNVV